jgi:hypothetical protein
MRQLTKEEILAAFGVPESVIGNASGRTFSNANEEMRVFWMETMMPHLEPLARAFDELDPKLYVDFDTSDVPILIMAKQERERYLMDEFNNGLISANEYRSGSGRKTLESEIADQLLSNPQLVPIANTEKPFSIEEQQPIAEAGAVPAAEGMPGAAPQQAMPGAEQQPAQEGAPADGQVAPADTTTTIEPVPEGQLSAQYGGIETKSADIVHYDTEWDTKAEQSSDRWVEILDASLERIFNRQQRVVTEKALGAKSRKAMAEGTLTVDSVFDIEAWNRQLRDDITPVINGIIRDSSELVSQEAKMDGTPDNEEMNEYVESQMERMEKVNETTREEVSAAILVAMAMNNEDEEQRNSLLRAAIAAIFANLLAKRRRVIAEHESQAAFNAGVYLASRQVGAASKTWVTRRDTRVRDAHRLLHGKKVGLTEAFAVNDFLLRFPGDPLAPPSLTINCRCRLRFTND